MSLRELTLARFTGLRGRGLRIQGLSNASKVIALLALGFRCTDVKSWEVWKGQTHQLQPAKKRNVLGKKKKTANSHQFRLYTPEKQSISEGDQRRQKRVEGLTRDSRDKTKRDCLVFKRRGQNNIHEVVNEGGRGDSCAAAATTGLVLR